MRRSHYLIIILLLFAQTSFGQIYQNMAQPGYKFSRARFDSVLTIPSSLGAMRNITGGQDTGQIRFNVSDSSVYVWNGRAWIKAGGGGVETLSAIGSTANANGATITGSVLNLQPASATFGGVLTTGTQSIAGLKQFQTDITVNGAINAVDGANTLVSIFNDGGSGMIELSQTGATGLTQYGKSSLTLTNAIGGMGNINTTNLSALRSYEMPNNSGTFALLSDTSTLSNRINLKLNISDTAAMLTPYAKTAAVALKVNISDTAAMLKPYLDTLQAHNTRIIAAGGAAVTVSSYGKNAGGDSTILLLSNGSRYAAKDSVGSGGGGGMAIGGTITSATAGSVLFAGTGGTLQQKNSALFYDSTNNRLGIGTATPAYLLDVNGDARVNGALTSTFLMANGASPISTGKYIGLEQLGTRSRITSFDWSSFQWIPITLGGSRLIFADNLGSRTEKLVGGSASFNDDVKFLSELTYFGPTETAAIAAYGAFSNASYPAIENNSMGLFNDYYGASRPIFLIGGKVNFQIGTGVNSKKGQISPTTGNFILQDGGTFTDVASARLQVNSTTQGVLFPRMTTTERNAISSPATALQVFSTTDSTNYIYRGTTSGWQATITGIRGSGTLDFGSIAHHSEEVLTFTVTGAAEGDVVSLGIPNASNLTNVIYTAWVSAANTVSVKCNNLDQSAAKDPASGTFKVTIFK